VLHTCPATNQTGFVQCMPQGKVCRCVHAVPIAQTRSWTYYPRQATQLILMLRMPSSHHHSSVLHKQSDCLWVCVRAC
jgi:hypothetical protein